MILSRSEEETLEEQILDCCVREEWEEAEVTLTARTRAGGRGRSKEEEGLRGCGARFRCSLEKESPAVSLAVHYCRY